MSSTERQAGHAPRTHRRAALVACLDCEYSWHSAAMVEGLRLLDSCPRCGGRLDFLTEPPDPQPDPDVATGPAPHLALGLPRPPRR